VAGLSSLEIHLDVTMSMPAAQLYNVMDDVVECFEENHNVRVMSLYLSPLGLCLIQFHSPICRQVMVNFSPHHTDEERVITVVEHDRGIHLRNCPFTRTCWVMFLAFPLDFHDCEIISQAVGLLDQSLHGQIMLVANPEWSLGAK
jgi:hypothetical protein